MKQIIPIVTLLTACLLFGCEESIVPDEEKIELVEEIVEVDSLICDEDSLIMGTIYLLSSIRSLV